MTSPTHERQWFIVGRWQEYDGELRANFLRIVGIGAFYVVELLNYYGLNLGFLHLEPVGENAKFHQVVTLLAAAWAMLALATLYCLRMRVFPAYLKFVTTGADIAFMTGLLMIADGPRSPLVIGYLLVIVLAALRLQLRLVWFATLGTMAGYLCLLGYVKWFDQRVPNLSVPRYYELIFLIGLALTGIALGQLIRRVRAMAEDFAKRIAAQPREAVQGTP